MSKFSGIVLGVGCGLAVGCASTPLSDEDDASGTLHFAISEPGHDVAAIRYRVVELGNGCSDAAVAEATIPIESERAPIGVLPAGAGDGHHFADGFFTLEPGGYFVCAVPLTSSGAPSTECSPAQAAATVNPGVTTEIVLVSECSGSTAGGLDVVTVLNDPPELGELEISPSKFVTTCETAVLTAIASDPDGDELTYSWHVVGGSALLVASNNIATFGPAEAGSYEINLLVTDIYGGRTELTFPIYVSDDDTCTPPVPDLSDIRQFYCAGTCGNWGDGLDCQQADADVFCQLKTNNPASIATSFTVEVALPLPGVCCPPPTNPPGSYGCIDLGISVAGLNVSVHPTDLLFSHGPGNVITNLVCTP
jgi:hypothetical protein